MLGPSARPGTTSSSSDVASDSVAAPRIMDQTARPSDTPHVTVVIPHFNYGDFLPQAVTSVLCQEGVRTSCVVVDDASAPEHRAVARGLADGHPDVELVQHTVNRGPVATFNDGLERVDGEFVVRLDADDALTPGALARATSLLRAHPRVGFCYGHPVHFDGSPPAARTRVRSWTVWPGLEWLERRCRLGHNCITSPEVVMRASVVEAVGGQRELDQAHDFEMWLRLATVSDVGHVDGADQAFHREHAASRSAVEVDEITDLEERWRAFRLALQGEHAPPGSAAAALLPVAQERLVREAVMRVRHERRRGREGSAAMLAHSAFALAYGRELLTARDRRSLAPRRTVPATLTRVLPTNVLPALATRLRADAARRRWHRQGI